jgi:hypothetical protein
VSLARSVTPHDIAELMAKLATNFGGKKDLEAKAELWYEKLQWYPYDVVKRVVDRLLATETNYFPKIGQAIALAKEMAPEYAIRSGPTPKAAMAEWERDPWGSLASIPDSDRLLCTSAPCPVCGSTVQFSDRGAVIVHDAAMHQEAKVGYSNLGNPDWFRMGPPPAKIPPPPKRLLSGPRKRNPYAIEVRSSPSGERPIAPAASIADVVPQPEGVPG